MWLWGNVLFYRRYCRFYFSPALLQESLHAYRFSAKLLCLSDHLCPDTISPHRCFPSKAVSINHFLNRKTIKKTLIVVILLRPQTDISQCLFVGRGRKKKTGRKEQSHNTQACRKRYTTTAHKTSARERRETQRRQAAPNKELQTSFW